MTGIGVMLVRIWCSSCTETCGAPLYFVDSFTFGIQYIVSRDISAQPGDAIVTVSVECGLTGSSRQWAKAEFSTKTDKEVGHGSSRDSPFPPSHNLETICKHRSYISRLLTPCVNAIVGP
jgi:hypothetical protein